MIKFYIVSTQDSDITPYDSGAYGSRQSYVTGNAVYHCGLLMKENILKYTIHMKPEFKIEDLDIVDNNVVTKSDGKKYLLCKKSLIKLYM